MSLTNLDCNHWIFFEETNATFTETSSLQLKIDASNEDPASFLGCLGHFRLFFRGKLVVGFRSCVFFLVSSQGGAQFLSC